MNENDVFKLASKQGYDRIKKGYPWNGYEVWNISKSELAGCRLGYPAYIISNGVETRFANGNERKQILHRQTMGACNGEG